MCKLRVLCEESVAGMYRVGSDPFGQIHNLLPVQESLDRPRPDEVGLVRFFHIDAGRVGLGVDGGGRDV